MPHPAIFGNYLLLEPLATGGMAELWRAKMFAGGQERLVALKRILPGFAGDEEFIAMFIDEGKIGFQLQHPHIVRTYEMGEISGAHFISLEYISGKPLAELPKPAPLPLSCYCMVKLCEGLDHAHRKQDRQGRDLNIVHRGLSLQDVLVSYEGEVKLIDFGIAKAAGRRTRTRPGIIKGRIGYMSPEQINGLAVDRRSDVFTLGVCLYELLTGRQPFAGDSVIDTVRRTADAKVEPPSTHAPGIPAELDRIVLKALSREPKGRYAYASELGEELQRVLTSAPTGFERGDLREYMQATFAEEVTREAQRQQDYARLNPADFVSR
jgi:serine/threonine protein kinase